MGIIVKQSYWNIIFIIAGFVIGGISRMFILPNVLTSTELGQLDLLLNHALLLATILCLGIPPAIIKFYSEYRNLNKDGALIKTLIKIPLFSSVIVALFLILFPDVYSLSVNENSRVFLEKNISILIIVLVSQVMYLVLNSVVLSRLNSSVSVFLTEVLLRFSGLIGVGLYYFNIIDYVFFVQLYAFYYLFQLLVLYYFFRKEPVIIEKRLNKEDKIRLYSFTSYSLLEAGATKLVAVFDVLMIGEMMLSKYVGFYSIGIFVSQVVRVPFRAIQPIASPLLAKAWAKNDKQEIDTIYTKSSLNLLILGGLLFSIIWISIDDIEMLLPEDFRQIKFVFLWLGLGNLLNLTFGLNGNIIQSSESYRMNFYFNITLLVLTGVFNFLLIPKFGIVGAAFATFMSLLIFNLSKFIFLWWKWNLQPFNTNHIVAILIPIILIYIAHSIYRIDFNIYLNIIFNTMLFGGIYVLGIFSSNISEDLNEKIKSILKIN